MELVLFDDPKIRTALLPLTYTRPVSNIRVGILTLSEKWERFANAQISYLTESYLSTRFPLSGKPKKVFVNGALIYNELIYDYIKNLAPGTGIIKNDKILAFYPSAEKPNLDEYINSIQFEEYNETVILIESITDIFQKNAQILKEDFKRITHSRTSQPINDQHTVVYSPENVFLETGAQVKAAIIDAENGPVYLDKNSVINAGAIIRGSLALGEGAQISMGAKMRGDTTVGPFCKVGGEVSNSVFFGYSNKSHDGFVGNSVVGEWCNIGADTNSSNMKNNYSNVRLWNYATGRFGDTGSMFCGFVMGDHTKLGINVMLNSGTSIGVACNLYNSNYFKNFIPSFTQGSSDKLSVHLVKDAVETAKKVLERRGEEFTEADAEMLQAIFIETAAYRK